MWTCGARHLCSHNIAVHVLDERRGKWKRKRKRGGGVFDLSSTGNFHDSQSAAIVTWRRQHHQHLPVTWCQGDCGGDHWPFGTCSKSRSKFSHRDVRTKPEAASFRRLPKSFLLTQGSIRREVQVSFMKAMSEHEGNEQQLMLLLACYVSLRWQQKDAVLLVRLQAHQPTAHHQYQYGQYVLLRHSSIQRDRARPVTSMPSVDEEVLSG